MDLRDGKRASTMLGRPGEHLNDAPTRHSRRQPGVIPQRRGIAPDAVTLIVVDLEPIHHPIPVGVPIHRIGAFGHVIVVKIDQEPTQFMLSDASDWAGLGRAGVEDVPRIGAVARSQDLIPVSST